MKKGGDICIDHAEALVAVDVNTGRFTGKKNQEDTIFRTNMEAAVEVPRQLRLHDIGGIIVVDFIDMESESNKRAVLDTLRTELRKDRARTKAFAVSDLGFVEMTRQRERSSLLHYYTEGRKRSTPQLMLALHALAAIQFHGWSPAFPYTFFIPRLPTP